MARFLDGYTPKKKKKQETTPKKAQSPSVSKQTQNRAKQAQQQKMYGGNPKPQTVRRSATTNNRTNTTTQQRQQTTSQQTQRTVDRLQQKYGVGPSYNRQATRRTQPRNSTISREGQRTVDRLTSKYGQNRVQRDQQEQRRRQERVREAQRQKMGLNNMASKKTQEAANRAIKNTPSLVKKAVQDTAYGHLQTIADVTEMTASNKNGTQAKAMKMGIQDNPEEMRKLEQRQQQTVEKAKLDREKWAKEQDERQKAWDKKVNGATGAEKAYYGAVESGTGMLTDLALGLGTQGGSLGAMFSRTYGQTRGQAEKEGATENEDRTYAFLQAAKEVGTELMFPGVGLAKGYASKKVGLPLAERAANNLTKNIRNRTAADIAGAGVRLLGGTAEENAEEFAGWGLDPLIKEFSYGRNVRTRQKMADLQTESDELRSSIQSEDDARRVASYLNSSEWLDQNKQQYMEAGLSEKKAEEVAEKMRDYMTASLTGDTKTMESLEKDIASTLSKGEFSYGKNLDKAELLDTLASTSLLTLTTGLPGTATTAMRGSVIRDDLGDDGIHALAELAMNFEDKEDSKRGEVARDRINAGKELTSTQVYELSVAKEKQLKKETQRVVAKNNVVANRLQDEKLVAPMIMRDEKGNIHGDPVITQRYNDSAQEAENVLKDIDKEQKLSLSDSELAVGSRAIAGFQTGAFTINDANALNYTNTAVRDAFEKVTGVDLGQYVVKTSSGAVDYAATNAATKDALFTMAADNFIETARAETENFKDITKGITKEQMAQRIGSEGDKAMTVALSTVDPADEDTYGLMASAAQNVYEYGRYTEDSWDDVSANLSEMYPGLSQDALQDVYEAAKRDKTIAENPYYNAKITAGESTRKMDMSEAGQTEYGKFTNETGEDIGMKERAVLESIASEFGINIRLMPSDIFKYTYVDRNGNEQTAYKNGWYDPKTGTMLLNGGNDMERNIIAVALHEITHHIAIYAPDEYLALSNRVMETWYKNDADAFSRAIQRKQDNYKAQIGQNLSEEQALEEVIADAMGEMSSDPDFISQICTEEPTLAEQIINAIRSVMRKLRAILASGNVAEEHEDAFFNQLGIWDDAQRLWLQAAKVAQQQRANQMIDDWDENARQNTPEEETVEEIAEDLEPKERFSLNEPVEQVRDLIAIHNLPEWKLKSTLELGGFPMPSIAVTNQDWTDFGDISILFGSDTIDPKKNRDNKVYSADAWTPTVPQTEYESDHMVVSNVYNTVKDLVGDEPYYRHGISGELHYQSIEQGLRNERGLDGYIERLLDKPYMQYAYLKSQGKEITIPQKDVKEEKDWKEARVDKYNELINMYGEDGLMDLIKMPMTDLFEREDVKQFIEDNLIKRKDGLSRPGKFAQRLYQDYIVEAVAYSMDADKTIGTKSVNDYSAANKMMDEQIDRDSMKAWLEGLFNGIIKDSGVYNGKDFFTPAGNSRTFKQLHYPATVDGIVRAMREQGEKNVSNYTSTKTLRADTAKSFKSLDEIRSRKDKLKSLTDNEVEAIYKELDDKFYSILNSIGEKSPREYDVFAADYIADVISECAQKNYSKPEQIIKQFAEYNWIASTEDANNILQLFNAIENMPVNMFEAKPRRAVGFDEVKAAIIPQNMDEDVKAGLESRGIPFYEYDPEIDGDRTKVVNQAATEKNLRFSISNDSRVMYTPKGIEVVQNPTDSEYTSMREEILTEYPWLRGTGEPLLRHTYDESGNEYYWSAFDGMHRDVEPYINRQYNTRTSQQWKWYEKPDKDDYPTDYSAMMARYSISEDLDEPYMEAVNSDNMEEAQRLVNEAAERAGYTYHGYHGTAADFNVFETERSGQNWSGDSRLGPGIYFAHTEESADKWSPGTRMINAYLSMKKPLDLREKTPDDLLPKVEEYYKKKLDDYEDWYPISRESYQKNLERLKEFDIDDPLSFLSHFKYDPDTEKMTDGMREVISELGYDGFISKDEMVVFNSSQVKSADTVTYAEDGSVIPLSERFDPTNNDIRYSLPTQDADGNILSDGQMEYFKYSQARDEQGRLVPVYHVTPLGGFTIFNPAYSFDETSLSFSNDMDFALNYSSEDGNPDDWRTAAETRLGDEETEDDVLGHYKVYLNMENPLILEGDYLDEMSIYEWPAYAKDNGYDGVIYKEFEDEADIYQVFSGSQIKDTRNTDPTNNPDIRYSIVDDEEAQSQMAYDDAMDTSYEALSYYETLIDEPEEQIELYAESFSEDKINDFYAGLNSYSEYFVFDDPVLEEGRKRMARSRADFMERLNAEWNERWLTDGEILDIRSVRKDVREMVKSIMRNADTPNKVKNDIVNKTLIDIRLAYQFAKKGRIDVADALLWHTSMRMIEGVEFVNDDTFNEYKDLRDYLRTTRIQLGEEYWSDVDYQAFRKNNFGRIKLVKGETNVDEIYQEMCERWPEWFNEEEEMTPPDQLLQIEHVLDVIQPYKEAYSSEEAASIATDIAYDLSDIVYGKGKPYESIADKYKNRYDKQTQAMRQRHEEALRKVREQREKGIKAERAKWQVREQRRKERQAHKKYFDRIVKNYDWLSERLLTNTKDKHIPEQYKKELAELLGAFDLQTVGSKKVEERRGQKGKKTIKMEAMKKAINNIEAKSEFFHLNDSITDIIDELLGREGDGSYNKAMSIEGKTIDELSVDELKKIDNLLKALKHEFNNYESVRTGVKRQQAADIGTAQVDSALKHAELFGPGKDYNNFLGAVDKIVNMDEMTPAYLFKRIDPNNTGLGMMFKELRRSFDKYVKNQEQLNGWMEEILSPYHSGGKAWKKYGAEEIENWRLAKATNTFKLQNGDEIRLTPAQMMSLYCLSKRPQAYQHMVGAGIVVKPVSFQAKLETDLKRKTNWALPTILTDGDIKMICTSLTPDQKKVADQLQQLMATKMAAWGNEASRAVIGIDLFEDPDYFPIQSDKAALEEDFTADQFVDMIRNFGFTKAVQPGARNAIAIDDIFTVVSTHCNNMNLYNAYSESMNDFMKVYNYHALREDGSDYSVKQAVAHAYSQKATTFISTFMRDLNGNVSKGRVTGIDNMMNAALGNAKKASVFANGRVALQQPTAIMRAFAVISPKYLKGVKVERGAMKEMFEHCPIALWKSWGYYDINMGKSIEDIMMNNGNWLEDKMTDIYGAADNVTWTAIWQMCKAEIRDKHPDVKEGSDEFWDLCNERMTEVVDLTQVVDSPFHRSHAMRDKQILVKMATSFMAEPTLTFNMVRDGFVNAVEMYKSGDKAGAAKLVGKTSRVFVLSAFATAAMAAVWDAVRGKQPDGDDDDDGTAIGLWWANTLANFEDNLKLWNNIYYIKDISSLFDGWGVNNLALQGWKQLADGYAQLTGTRKVSSNKSWWENMLAGIGYLTGTPFGTILKDGKALMNIFGVRPAFLSDIGDRLDSVQDMLGGSSSGSGVGRTSSNNSSNDKKSGSDESDSTSAAVRLWTYDNAPFKVENGSMVDNFLNHFGVNLTSSEIAAAEAKQAQKEHDKKVKEITNSLSEYSGEEYDKKLWDKSDLEGYGKALEAGDFEKADEIEKLFIDCGGSREFLNGKKLYHYKKNYAKTIVYDPTDAQIEQQTRMKDFLLSHGMSEAELSEKVYKSQTCKELKVAFRLNDEDAIVEELTPLIRAGLSYDDFVKAYKNRNRIDLKKYKDSDGKYAERLKSTGVYNWPVNGTITSNFGYRHSPGGVGSTNHKGLDIAAGMGTPVGAADGGTVVYAGWDGGFGKCVRIQHDDGTITEYGHLSWWEAKVGDTVAQGQTIGKVGSTGNSTGPHLHFGVKVNGSYVDPLTKLN